MPTPAEPIPDVDPSSAPSGHGPRAETATRGRDPSATDVSAPTGFGPPAAVGEVGTLGPYRVVRELGRGGMGAVYAAVDSRLDRQLALKVMLPEFAADASATGRFLREARAAAKVKHDNVVVVYEADERDGVPYIAMEFLDGLPLDAYLKTKGNPAIRQVVRIAAEAAAGLAAAHAIGLVHRDVKPANLWLEAPNGRVKVLDFGLARPVNAEVELTQSGAVVGTPAYMSPEQARGERVDHRTDLFSLGALLYRLCTGTLPFRGPSAIAVLMALGTEEPRPVRELNPDVPEALAVLVHQLLSKPADVRPQTADEVRRRLSEIAQELAAPRGSELSVSQPQVVYVATPVTAADANPFVDIDAPDPERTAPDEPDDSSDAAPLPPKRRWLWPAVGLAALVVATGGVLVAVGNSGKREPKANTPVGVPAGVPGLAVKVGPELKQPADAEREAAGWLLSIGKPVEIAVGGGAREVGPGQSLPSGAFTLARADLTGNKRLDPDGFAALARCKGLRYLSVFDTNATDDDLKHFDGISTLNQLHLSLSGATGASLHYFRNCGELKTVHLWNVPCTDGHLRTLDLRALEHLNACGTRVTDVALEIMQGCRRLKHLNLRDTQVNGSGLALLAGCAALEFLTLDQTAVGDGALAALPPLPKLARLELLKTKVTATGVAELHKRLPRCQIVWDGGVIEPDDVDRAAAEYALSVGGTVRVNGEGRDRKAAAELPKEQFVLTGVSLDGNQKVTAEGLARFEHCTSLTLLYLQHAKADDAGLAHFRNCKELETLNLGGTDVTAAGLAAFKGLNALKDLNLYYTQVGDAGLVHFKDCKKLTGLNLYFSHVTDAGLVYFKECKALNWISLWGNEVTDAGVANFRGCDALAFLDLGNTKVSDAGLTNFKDCKALKELRLQGAPVGDAGLAHLKALANLTTVHLKQTKVTEKGVKELATALPACKIEWDGGVIEPKN